MPKDSIIMHYLDSLVSADAMEKTKDSLTCIDGDKFFVIKMEDTDDTDSILRKKIDVIKNIQKIQAGNPAIAASFFAPFAENYLNLQRAYIVLLQSYKKDISQGNQVPSRDLLLEIADKMILAALLEGAVFRDSHTHRAQLRLLEQLLYDLTSEWSTIEGRGYTAFNSQLTFKNTIVTPNNYIRNYSEWHNKANIWRFTIVRFWRWLTVQFSRAFAYLTHCISWIQALRNNGVGSFFAYFAWVFFIPALLINFGTLIYSAIGTSSIFGSAKLPAIEREYGWYLRLKIRLKENFFEILTQSMWFTAGLINCFALAGSLPIVGVYIMVIAQVYDFSVIMLRNFLENRRLDKFMSDLKEIRDKNKLDDPNNYIANFSKRIESDQINLLFAIFNFMVLLMCIVLMTQAFGNISPFIPLVASFITIIVAPLRGLTVDYFRKESGKLNPPLIRNDAYGARVIEGPLDTNNFTYLGRYTKGLVITKNGESIKWYKYDKNNQQKYTEVDANYNFNEFTQDPTLFSRVKTVSKENMKNLDLNFQEERTWMSPINSMRSVLFGA